MMAARPVALVPAMVGDRARDLALLAGVALWMVYTRLYFVLHGAHLAMPPCPFYYLTGHPCPFCGGTRSFAYMWQGDVADAVRMYPLGPPLFAGAFAAAAGLVVGIARGRTFTFNLSTRQWWGVTVCAISLVAVSWTLKVFVLGN